MRLDSGSWQTTRPGLPRSDPLTGSLDQTQAHQAEAGKTITSTSLRLNALWLKLGFDE